MNIDINIDIDKVNLLMTALRGYLRSNGLKVLSIARATGQKYVNIALRGLFWYYTPIPDYPKLMNVIKDIKGDERALVRLREYGIDIIELNGEYYLRMHVSTLAKLVKEALEG